MMRRILSFSMFSQLDNYSIFMSFISIYMMNVMGKINKAEIPINILKAVGEVEA